ncbi:cytokinin-O-glucosyltransferase 2 [Panicum miliaceum]|uniref:Cytokinin-O-glucosyltransferase 2 n=1 Tax=Panicum miliaceum TaxID=4540 RepID=A0A3L6RUK3_PANMI|nr:cytokinin-O-glucosyltransferase 2 [Panicum miliaceum]
MLTSAAAKAVVLNRFCDMEKDIINVLKPLLPPIYTVGPLASAIPSPLPAPGRERRHGHPAAVGRRGVHGVAGRQGGGLCRVPELRQPRQHGGGTKMTVARTCAAMAL